jgi:cellulose synthase/poly-beta-1,6-N-acetylglucosamine synthase-like glycosyltransferase
MSPYVIILVTTYNDRVDLYFCVQFIRSLDYPKEKIEIIIWDNASEDNTKDTVGDLFSWLVEYISMTRARPHMVPVL